MSFVYHFPIDLGTLSCVTPNPCLICGTNFPSFHPCDGFQLLFNSVVKIVLVIDVLIIIDERFENYS